ncbi:50S ribosomal protein L31 [Malacoplasma penetrans]|nr:50S ribosomal protein L31 [Malacoplasma penetrans]RXY97356.1 50S ribosomal protein L31 [Malacoplasma penetrans]
MKKETHMKLNEVSFNCASCNSTFVVKSTLNTKETSIDVCSSCHPFYIGTSMSQQVKGRAEKFNKKVVAVKQEPTKSENKNTKKQSKKVVHSLNSL